MREGQWVDDTSYTYERPKSEQPVRILSLQLDGMRLVLHRLVNLPGWYCSMTDNGRSLVRDRLLTEAEVDVEEAKLLALAQGIDELQECTGRYERLLAQFKGD